MKYIHKCALCNKEGNKKFHNFYLCDSCKKEIKSSRKKVIYIWIEEHVYSVKDPDGSSFAIYRDRPIKVKY